MFRGRIRHVFNVFLADPSTSEDRVNDQLPPIRSHVKPPILPRDYGSRNKDHKIALGDHNHAVSPGTSTRDRTKPIIIPSSTPNGRKLPPNTPGSSVRSPCSRANNLGEVSPLVQSLRCSCSNQGLDSSNDPPVHDTIVTLTGLAGTSQPTTPPVAASGSRQLPEIPTAVGYPTEASTSMNDRTIQGHLKALLGSRSFEVSSSSSRTAEPYPAKMEHQSEEARHWVIHERGETRDTGAPSSGGLAPRSRTQDSSPPPLNPSHSPSSPTRVSDSIDKLARGKFDESKQTQSGLSGTSAPQLPPLALTRDGATGLDTPTARSHSEPTLALDQPSSALISARHVDLPGPHKDDQSSRPVSSGSQPFVVDASPSVMTDEYGMTPIHPSELADQPAGMSASSDLAGDEAIDNHTPGSAFASADETCPIQRHDQEHGQPSTTVSQPEELPVATTATRTRAISDSESEIVKAHDNQSHNKNNEMLSSIKPDTVLKEPNALCLSCLMGIDDDGCTCARPSGGLSRRQRSIPLSKLLTVLSSGLEGSWIVGLPMKRNEHASTVKALSLASFPVRPRQRKLRVGQLLRLICPYTFAFDPSTSGSGFQFGQAFGVGQNPGNTFPRSGDGGGIWSGQGPGAGLNTLSLQAPGSFEIPSSLEDLVQALSNSFPGPSHASASSSVAQYVRNAPNPPVPLHPDTVRKLLLEAFAAGVGVGLSLGNARAGSSETTLNGFGPQQPNPSGVAQAEITSSIHHPAPDPSAGPSHNEANWPSDLSLAGLGALAPGLAGLPEVQPPINGPTQPTDGPANTEGPVNDIPWDSWIQPSALHVDAYPSVTPRNPGVPLVANHPPDGDTDSATAIDQSIGPSESIPLASQTHATQVATAPTIGLKPQALGTQSEDEGNEGRHCCKRCGVSFRRRYLLDDHISVAHEKGKRHPCTAKGCKKRYASHSGMMRHFKQAHLQTANSQDAPSPSIEQGQGDIQNQTPGAGPSNRNTFRENTRSSRAFIPYDPNSARHKSCFRERSGV